MGFRGSGLARPVECMLLVAVLYEPLRNALHRAGAAVGGVGGVGGLSNLGDPASCNSLAGQTENYCFVPGVFAGLTPMALVVLLLWCAPLALGAAAMAASKGRSHAATSSAAAGQAGPDAEADAAGLPSRSSNGSEISPEIMLKAWSYISLLWFIVPLAGYLADPFFRTSFPASLLAVSIAAAFPLSWHLAFVAVPVSDSVAPWLGIPRSSIYAFHKAVGWRTCIWGCVHVCGELVWLLHQGFWKFVRLSSPADGENVLYIFGIVCGVLLALHSGLAYLRKQRWLAAAFKKVHRVLAVVLFLAATVHWWPFALFLLPAASAHGAVAGEALATAAGRTPSAARRLCSLAGAFLGAFLGLAVVWTVRQSVMGQNGAGLIVPSVFPPLALLAEGFGATFVAMVLCAAGPKAAAGGAMVDAGGSQELLG